MRPVLPLLLSCSLALAGAAACGGDSAGEPSGASTPSAEASLSADAAARIAEASVLVAADLPGYASTPASDAEDPDEEKAEEQLEKCVGVQSPDYLGEATSDDFSKGEPPAAVEVSSEVQVVATQAEGEADLKAFLSDKALSCFEDFVGTALADVEEQGLTIGEAKVSRTTVTKPAQASDAFGLRFTTSFSVAGQSFPVVIDIVGALVGRAELSVVSFSTGEELAASEQSRLLGVMAERAAKAQA